MSSPHAWTLPARSSASGANDLLWLVYQASRSNLGAVALLSFPPSVVVQVKALACELPHRLGLPLSRLSLADIRQEAVAQGIVAQVSGTTLWRWLSADALRPWPHRSWIFPGDPDFACKAGRILDLYARVWQGKPLHSSEFVICADEKTSIQARRRKQPTLPVAAGRPCGLNTSISGKVLGPIWQLGTSTVPSSSDTVKRRVALLPPIASSLRSCAANPTNPLSASFGSWITARLIAVRRQSIASDPAGPTLFWCIPRFMPVGSIKLRSISRSSKERCSRSMTFPRSPTLNFASS